MLGCVLEATPWCCCRSQHAHRRRAPAPESRSKDQSGAGSWEDEQRNGKPAAAEQWLGFGRMPDKPQCFSDLVVQADADKHSKGVNLHAEEMEEQGQSHSVLLFEWFREGKQKPQGWVRIITLQRQQTVLPRLKGVLTRGIGGIQGRPARERVKRAGKLPGSVCLL